MHVHHLVSMKWHEDAAIEPVRSLYQYNEFPVSLKRQLCNWYIFNYSLYLTKDFPRSKLLLATTAVYFSFLVLYHYTLLLYSIGLGGL